MLLGGIEAGGTKMICAVADEYGNLHDKVTIPTEMPHNTIPQMISYFKDKDIAALGIGCFGPIELNVTSSKYGYITNTPKEGWKDTDMLSVFKSELNVPVNIDTDVNAAIYGEVRFGKAQTCNNAIYITIGTGIGVGVWINGKLLHGLTHPEAGHILIQPYKNDNYEGCCPYHKNCFEGFASGPAIHKRWGKPANMLYDNKEVWEFESYYIAQAITNYILSYSPEKIVLWGGVMHNENLFASIRKQVLNNIGRYIDIIDKENINNYIVMPGLGDNAGIIGATQLGYDVLR